MEETGGQTLLERTLVAIADIVSPSGRRTNLLEIALRRIVYEGVHSVVVTADLAGESSGDTASVIVIVNVLTGCTTGHANAG